MKTNLDIPLNLAFPPKHPFAVLNLSDIAAMWIDYDPEWENKLEDYIQRAVNDGRAKSDSTESAILDYQSPSFAENLPKSE